MLQVLVAVVHAFLRAAPFESLLFLLFQVFFDNDVEVFGVSLGPLEVLVLISLSKLLEVSLSICAESLHTSLEFSHLALVVSSPKVVLGNAVGLIRALSQSSIVPFWWNGERVD